MSMTVGQFLVGILAANGIDTVFGIPGVHNLEAYRGIASCSLRHILVRHEQGAGFAADGHARASGRIAAAFVISGPGLTNILTSIAQAYSDSVPVLVIATTPARATLGKRWGVLHELRNQQLLASGIFGVTRTARSATDVRDHLRACLASLRSGRTRPAYLEVPLDLLAEQTELVAGPFDPPSQPPAPAARQVAVAIEHLSHAERALIIVGGGARGAVREVVQLADCVDGYVASTAAGKGILPEDHPANLGASLPYAPTQKLVAAADLILAVGTELSETDIYTGFRLPRTGRMIRIDVDPAKLADAYTAEVPIWGDARLTLEAILRGLTPRSGWRSAAGPASVVRSAIEASFPPLYRTLQRVIAALQAGLPEEAIVFSDMTQVAYAGNYAFRANAPRRWHHPSGYGTLGFALPAALGAKIASPACAIVALAGDYGLQFTLGELMTAVEAAVSLPIVVWNNGALGQIRDDMVGAGIPPTGVVGLNPDFQLLAQSYGAAATQVHDAAGLTTALRTALATPRPTLIEIIAADFTARTT